MEISDDDMEERGRCIQDASSKGLLDGVFRCYYYNNFTKRWGPGLKPTDVSVHEIFPSISDSVVADLVRCSARLFGDADQPAMARLGYPDLSMSYEDALLRFKASNPGFSDDSYRLALHAAMVNNR